MMTMPPQTFDLRKNPTVSEITVYTVAAEGEANPENFDFVDLEAALTFAERADMVGGGVVALELADGTHYFRRNPKQPSVGGNSVAAYNFNHCHLYLYGSDKANCTLRFDPNITVGSGQLFRIGNSKFSIKSITVYLSNNENKGVYFLRTHNSYIYYVADVFGANRGAFSSCIYGDGGNAVYIDGKISGFYAGILCGSAGSDSVYSSSNMEIADSKYGVWDRSKMSTVLVRNNGADIKVASQNIGEITKQGGIVSDDEWLPPSLLGWTGATADRPTLPAKPYAQPYFDTDLGYPIWWNGTAWVDATGTEV